MKVETSKKKRKKKLIPSWILSIASTFDIQKPDCVFTIYRPLGLSDKSITV